MASFFKNPYWNQSGNQEIPNNHTVLSPKGRSMLSQCMTSVMRVIEEECELNILRKILSNSNIQSLLNVGDSPTCINTNYEPMKVPKRPPILSTSETDSTDFININANELTSISDGDITTINNFQTTATMVPKKTTLFELTEMADGTYTLKKLDGEIEDEMFCISKEDHITKPKNNELKSICELKEKVTQTASSQKKLKRNRSYTSLQKAKNKKVNDKNERLPLSSSTLSLPRSLSLDYFDALKYVCKSKETKKARSSSSLTVLLSYWKEKLEEKLKILKNPKMDEKLTSGKLNSSYRSKKVAIVKNVGTNTKIKQHTTVKSKMDKTVKMEVAAIY